MVVEISATQSAGKYMQIGEFQNVVPGYRLSYEAMVGAPQLWNIIKRTYGASHNQLCQSLSSS